VGAPLFENEITLEHPYTIAFIVIVAFVIWMCIKINEDDEPET
jgi:hypothetical protein